MDFSKKLGKRIKELRSKSNLTQDRAAELAGINPKYLGEIERGEVNVSVLILSKLSFVFDVEITSLLDIDHHSDIKNVKSSIYKMIDTASDEQIRRIYRSIQIIVK